MTALLRVAVVTNKAWECEPLEAVLLAREARPGVLKDFRRGYDPAEAPVQTDPETGEKPSLPPEADALELRGSLPIRPRLSFSVSELARVEVWCVEDWMRRKRRKPGVVDPVPASSSSSHEKFCFALPRIRERAFRGLPADLVIGFGTAAIPAPEPLNGCVTVGTRVYLHDAWQGATPHEIAEQEERFGPLLRDGIPAFTSDPLVSPRLLPSLFSTDMSAEARHSAEARFLFPPISPACPPRILAGHGFASLGTLNICDYDDYVWADAETLELFESQVRQREIGSMETTHGLIRLTWGHTPFIFVSGLANKTLLYNVDTSPRRYVQNFVAAHNAAVSLSHLLPELARLNASGRLFRADDRVIEQ